MRVVPLKALERGSALLCTLMVISLIATLTAALALVVTTEARVIGNYYGSQQGLYAAEAGVERTIGELRGLPTWRDVPGSSSTTPAVDFNDALTVARAPDGSTVDLAQLTVRRQTESDAVYPAGPDRPIWRLYAHAPLDRMLPGAQPDTAYVVVWVADDSDDLDGNPGVDANGMVMIRAEAFGSRGSKQAVEATIAREEAMDATLPGIIRSDVRTIVWREVR
jgi:hypothetical protein